MRRSKFIPGCRLPAPKAERPDDMSKENRDFQRSFLSGVVTVELDGSGRFLVPRNLLTYASLDKEALLVGTGSKVEIWDPATYRKNLISDPGDLSKLAEKYLNQ